MAEERTAGRDEVQGTGSARGVVRDLQDAAGLPIRVAATGRLEFGDGLPVVSPQVRTLNDVRSVLYNQTATSPEELYYMYRGVGYPEDVVRFVSHSLRFDITVLVPGLVGGEYVKTAGHYHPPVDDGSGDLTYPEIYQVLYGQAHYLLQKPGPSGPRGALADVVVVEAGPGECLYVPPNYGHVTINVGPSPLVMVNVVDSGFTSLYGPYRERHGAAYYEIEGDERSYLVVNDHYPDPPEPRLAPPTRLEGLGLVPGEPVYRQLARDPLSFAFLSRPSSDGPVP